MDKLIEIITSLMPFECVVKKNSQLLEDLGFDSLKMVELLLTIEREYKFEFEDSALDLSEIKTVEDLDKIIYGYLQ